MGCDGLGFSSALNDEELRENGDTLEPNGKGPEDFWKSIPVWEDHSQEGGTTEQKPCLEGVDIRVVSRAVDSFHKINRISTG